MAKKLKNYEVLVKALNNFSLVDIDINVLKNKKNVFKKNKELSAMGFANPYLIFTEEDETPFTLQAGRSQKNWDGILEYSTDTKNWNEWDGTIINSSDNGELYLRGSNNSVISGGANKGFSFAAGKKIHCNGNIETLLDYKKVQKGEHPVMGDNCFSNLFNMSRSLLSAPELPATELSPGCYTSMFSSSSITTAPELPATELSPGCYTSMFRSCSLTQPPLLPALKLAEKCYSYMFASAKMAKAPELPATTLAPNCYEGMFSSAEIKTPPAILPALELADYCYYSMFRYAEKLTTTPELPATTLSTGCYKNMFNYCKSLVSITGELPAKRMEKECYYEMFRDCAKLQTAPEKLPATILANNCYKNMFLFCSSMTGTIHCPESNLKSAEYLVLNSSGTATVAFDLK